MTDTWHARPDALARYALDPAALDHAQASSVEAHLLTCAACRAAVAEVTPVDDLSATWAEVADRIDRPRASWFERVLVRLGVDAGPARLVAATGALRAAGFLSIVAVAAGAVALSCTSGAETPFLVLAPLAPLFTVAAAFAPAGDPSGEAGKATPMHGAALVVRRAVAVFAVSFGALLLATLALPDLALSTAGWVLPALALALGALALGTWVRVETAVAGLAFAWIALVSTTFWLSRTDAQAFVDSVLFDRAGQLVALAAALAAGTTLTVRRDRLATLEVFR